MKIKIKFNKYLVHTNKDKVLILQSIDFNKLIINKNQEVKNQKKDVVAWVKLRGNKQ